MGACFCDYDYDPAKVYRATRPRAAKEHKCYECGRKIQPGERYERVGMLYDSEWSAAKTCVYCLAIRDLVAVSSCCFCWLHGSMLEDVWNELDVNGYKMPGLGMAVGRLMVEARREKRGESCQK